MKTKTKKKSPAAASKRTKDSKGSVSRGSSDYSKPLKNSGHERFAQEYIVKSNNATQSYKIAYPNCSIKTAEQNGHQLLKNTKIKGRIRRLQDELSEVCGVTKKMLMAELKKIGFANIKSCLGLGGKIKDVSQLPEEVTAAIESLSITKTGTKVTFHPKLKAIEDMGKHIGFFEKDNELLAATLLGLFKKHIE